VHPPYALAALRPLSISALMCLPWLAWVSLKVSFRLHILGAYAPHAAPHSLKHNADLETNVHAPQRDVRTLTQLRRAAGCYSSPVCAATT
jgi:hypothetical protein